MRFSPWASFTGPPAPSPPPLWQIDFSLGAEQLGTVIGVIFIATILAQAPLGAAFDRLGARAVLTPTIALVAFGTYACLWATGYGSLVLARTAIGVGLASTGVGMYLILARHFRAEDFGVLNGLMATLGGIGGLLATYPLAALVEAHGWRPVFAGLALVTVLLAAAVFSATAPHPNAKAGPKDENMSYGAILVILGLRPILALSVVTYAPIVAITGLWGGPYFTVVHALSLSATGAILFALFAATMLAGTAFGLFDKWGLPRRTTILAAAFGSAFSFAAAALGGGSGPWAAALCLFVAIFAQGFYIPLLAEVKHVVPDAALGRATSVFSIISVGAIPVFQTGYGTLVARAENAAQGHQTALLAMATLIALLALFYAATARSA